jgi:hypothetical protein
MTSWDLTYYLLRANYDRVDSPYLEGAKLPESKPTDGKIDYRYGVTVTNVVDEGSHVRVYVKRMLEDGGEFDGSLTTRLLVAADGPSSTIRSILEPSIERHYAGYAVIRGTVPEPEASQAALDVFRERFCFFHAPGMQSLILSDGRNARLLSAGKMLIRNSCNPGIQNLTYTIAGENGNTEPGNRLLNFVWYANFPEGSDELERIMTDKDGRRRRVTIPPGMIRS